MKTLFNDGWKFLKTELDYDMEKVLSEGSTFSFVQIPHDWLIYDTNNLYENSCGWYMKEFEKPELTEGGHAFLYFEGVYMDSTVYVNGQKVGEWKYGYSSFFFDITKFLVEGNNTVLVKVNYQSPNSRWYSGAGIYRNVWLIVKPEAYIVPDGTYVHSESAEDNRSDFNMTTEVEVAGTIEDMFCRISLYEDKECNKTVFSEVVTKSENGSFGLSKIIHNPTLWDVDAPKLYTVKVSLLEGDLETDTEIFQIGFKDIVLTKDKGLFLNGRRLKINGTCEHHDLGALGAAVNREAIKRRLSILKEFGVNSIRTSHNMPAVELLDLCDEMGFMVMDEAFDMWEYSKTPYDYARFFKEWSARDVESWIKRDRNRACLIMWSIGNEIGDTHAGPRGQEITRYLMELVYKYDPLHNAPVTTGSNYMPWENAQKCADIMKLVGYNYAERCYEEHHEKHPDWTIFGSETASLLASRGVYRFPLKQQVMAEIDEQCSALGNSGTSWGAKSVEDCIIAERDHEFSLGQYLWSGFDYIGEPTPYHTKNSYLGQLDTAGFPKDTFFIFGSEWNLEEFKENTRLHMFPYWDWNDGQRIDVRVTSNAPFVELLINGKSQGIREIDHKHGTELCPTWSVLYEKGNISARCYDENRNVLGTEVLRNSFGDSVCPMVFVEDYGVSDTDGSKGTWFLGKTEHGKLPGQIAFDICPDGRKLYFLDISMSDENGNPVENAMDYVTVTVSENAKVVGMDNGDSTDYDSYQSNHRKLFNGKLLCIVEAVGEGNISVSVKRDLQQVPVRKIELSAADSTPKTEEGRILLTPDNSEATVMTRVMPAEATNYELFTTCVNVAGIEINFAKSEMDQNTAKVKAIGDGDFVLRVYAKEENKVTIISQLEFTARGFGQAFTDPYEFVIAGLFDKAIGEIGTGNEKGIATSRTERSGVLFDKIDFGDYGSDEVTLWIFALNNDNYPIEIYDGDPEKNGKLIDVLNYQKRSIWNTYQEETYRLPERLRGVHSLAFVSNGLKFHFKGFLFKKYEKAYEKLDCSFMSKVTGDSFDRTENAVLNIGNNVTLTFENIELGNDARGIRIFGKTVLDKCAIRIDFTDESGRVATQIVEFAGANTEQSFEIKGFCGKGRVDFIFLPGSKFDFFGFCFLKA